MNRNAAAYDVDFAAWTFEQARLMRDGQFAALDVENLAEELESMGRRLRRELRSRLTVLVTHLLKWERQPDKRSRSWSVTILAQRHQLADLLDESPSLRSHLVEELAKAYPRAVQQAAEETTIFLERFPTTCPYVIDAILDESFMPGGDL